MESKQLKNLLGVLPWFYCIRRRIKRSVNKRCFCGKKRVIIYGILFFRRRADLPPQRPKGFSSASKAARNESGNNCPERKILLLYYSINLNVMSTKTCIILEKRKYLLPKIFPIHPPSSPERTTVYYLPKTTKLVVFSPFPVGFTMMYDSK